MSLFDLNQVDTVPMSEEDQEQTSNPILTVTNEISSYPCPVFLEKSHGHGEDNRGYFLPEQLLQQEPKDHSSLISESSYPWVSHPSSNGDINNKIKLSLWKRCTKEEEPQGPGKWMSSKMRIVKKMNSEDSKPRGNMQVAEDQSQTDLGFSTSNYSIKPPSGIIRVCSNCNTTKTPLWRSGLHGPKSLCNACGIRQRKARRAMEAGVMNSRVMVSEAPSRVHKEKKPDIHHTLPFKKRCKITSPSTSRKQLRFEDVTLSLGTNSEFHEVFPQDERDAAILLMALSCGVIQS